MLWRLFSGYAACEKLKHGKAERLKEESGYGGQPEAADQETKGPRDEGGEKRQGALGERGQAERTPEDKSLEIGDGVQTSSSELPSSASRGAKQAKLFVIGPKPHMEAELLDCPYRELQMPLARLEKTRLSMHKRSLAALGLVPLPSHEHVMNLLGDFKPEVVVCVMANTPWILTAERTARKLGVPLVLIVHDINEEFEKVFPWAKDPLFTKNRDVYRSAARRLCVSPEMAEFLEKRYGVPGEVMYPNRSEELQPRPLEMSLTLRAEVAAATPGDGR